MGIRRKVAFRKTHPKTLTITRIEGAFRIYFYPESLTGPTKIND